MSRRNKAPWVVCEGGPLSGRRMLLPPPPASGLVAIQTSEAGRAAAHEYQLTLEYRRVQSETGQVVSTQVATFVRTQPT